MSENKIDAANASKKEEKVIAENQVGATAGNQSEPAKKKRRGISNDTRGTSRLKFDTKRDIKPNGLFLGHLDSIEVKSMNYGDKGESSFAGLEVPVFVATFASNDDNALLRKYVTLTIRPGESNALTIPGGKDEWIVTEPFNWLKHLLNVYVFKGRAMTDAEEDLLSLPYEDFDDDMQYVPVDVEEVLAGWRVVFENVIALLNNDGKPHYKNAKGNFIAVWLKLLVSIKRNGNWESVVGGKSTAGDLGFAKFVGEGAIEVFQTNVPPTMRVNPVRESVVYQQTKKDIEARNGGSKPAMGGAIQGGIPIGGGIPAMPAMPDYGGSADTGYPAPDYTDGSGDVPYQAGIAGDGMPF